MVDAPRQGTVLVLCAEDGIADTVRPRIDKHGGDASAVYILEGVREERGLRHLNLALDLAALEQAIVQVQPQLVIIDPITAYLARPTATRTPKSAGCWPRFSGCLASTAQPAHRRPSLEGSAEGCTTSSRWIDCVRGCRTARLCRRHGSERREPADPLVL